MQQNRLTLNVTDITLECDEIIYEEIVSGEWRQKGADEKC